MVLTETEKQLDDFWIGGGPYMGLTSNSDEDAAEAIKRFLTLNIVIPRTEPADGEVTVLGEYVAAGSGPERASSSINSNPNWLRNRAMNLFTLADYLENRDAILAAKEAEAAAARDKRRDELAASFAENGRARYGNCTELSQKAIDHIIDMEEAQK